jgi:uncharacterized protein YbaR (Trm112 family)
VFIELTEILKCPRDHAESYVICGPVTMEGRDVVRGGIVCPSCRAEFPIVDRVAFFGPPDEPVRGAVAAAPPALTVEGVLAFLDLQGDGGYVVTVGAPGRLGPALGAAMPKVRLVGVNPPAGAAPSDAFSVIVSPRALPIRARSVRAIILGAEVATGPWLESSVAALLPGLRIVIEDESASPAGITRLAAGGGVFVGEK